MQENIFSAVQPKPVHAEEAMKARRAFDRHMREAVRLLMARKEGRVFVRWLGAGQSAQSILQLIMDYEEEKHGGYE